VVHAWGGAELEKELRQYAEQRTEGKKKLAVAQSIALSAASLAAGLGRGLAARGARAEGLPPPGVRELHLLPDCKLPYYEADGAVSIDRRAQPQL
jgi:hypothetical protein